MAASKKDEQRENKTRLTESTGKLIGEGRGNIGGEFTVKASRQLKAELVFCGCCCRCFCVSFSIRGKVGLVTMHQFFLSFIACRCGTVCALASHTGLHLTKRRPKATALLAVVCRYRIQATVLSPSVQVFAQLPSTPQRSKALP